MTIFESIEKPTLLLDPGKAKQNIQRMCRKANEQNIRFRPHFKTHQSAEIGEWFRQEGVTAITVSSLDMARYFAEHGWQDITLAFPVNIRQVLGIASLAQQIHLEILVESIETVHFLAGNLSEMLDVWIKVDAGSHRTGLAWDAPQALSSLANAIQTSGHLELRGLLTHAAHTYKASSPAEVRQVYSESIGRMHQARYSLADQGFNGLEVSVGDTPGCSLCDNLGEVDEIRPGNFVFFDAQQLALGSCRAEDIAVAVACPVVAKHPERQETVIYGGAIHLSKEAMPEDGQMTYGKIALPGGMGWGEPLPGAYMARISQEHGVVHMAGRDLDRLHIGDLLCVLPVHSCLTVQVMGEYLTLAGEVISTMGC